MIENILSVGWGTDPACLWTVGGLAVVSFSGALGRRLGRWFSPAVDYRRELQEYSRALATMLDLDRLLNAIANGLDKPLQPTGLAIVLADVDEGYHVAFSRGMLAEREQWQEGSRFGPTSCIPRFFATPDRPLILDRNARSLPVDQQKTYLDLLDTGVELLVPMHRVGTLQGWLALGAKASSAPYSRREIKFACALAGQSSISLENARLYGEIQERATGLAMLSMVSSAISSSLDVERVLQTVVESVVQVVGCAKAAVFVPSPDRQELRLGMQRGFSPLFVEESRRLEVGKDPRTLSLVQAKPVVVPDLLADSAPSGLAKLARQEGIRAGVDVPLAGREKLLGVLSVYYDKVHRPSDSELDILVAFANQVATAIENARLYAEVTCERDKARKLYKGTHDELARRVTELTAVEEIGRHLNSTLDLQRVLKRVLSHAESSAAADRCVIALYDADRQALWLEAQSGYPPSLERYRIEPFPVSKGIIGRTVRTKELVLVDDVSEDGDYVAISATSRSQLAVPIKHGEDVIGAISLESDRPAAFTEEHVRFVQLLSDHAGIAIHNAQLFRQVTESRDQLGAILDSAHDAIVVTGREGRVILCNPQVREMFGPEVSQWLHVRGIPAQLTDADLVILKDVNQEDLGKLRRWFERMHEDTSQDVAVSFAFQKGDAVCHVEGTASPVVAESGEVIGRVAVLRNMTGQKDLERFREDMTGMVIHNLQGPLAALISSLEILQSDHGVDEELSNELLRICLDSGQRLYDRINSLLWIRRLESNEFPLDLQALPMQLLVEPVFDEYRPMASMLNVELLMDVAPDLPQVLIDSEVIGRVLSNLVDNALKFTAEQGQVTIRARVDHREGVSWILCSVVDTGVGLSRERQAAAFDAYLQSERSLRGKRKGWGIGLHFCKVAVQAHGGQIWVESEEGVGSIFTFTLPVRGPYPRYEEKLAQ